MEKHTKLGEELLDKQELPTPVDIEAQKPARPKRLPKRRPGNPKGIVLKNSPRDLSVALNKRFTADFRKHGIAVIERVRKESPVEYLKIATKLIPKDVNLTIEHTFSEVLFEAHNIIQERKYQESIAAEIEIDADS